jgi:DNA phosphorothioation-dependent restriction protein DptG
MSVGKDETTTQFIKDENMEDENLKNIDVNEDGSNIVNMAQKQKTIFQKKLRQIQENTSFADLDEKYIKPFLHEMFKKELNMLISKMKTKKTKINYDWIGFIIFNNTKG